MLETRFNYQTKIAIQTFSDQLEMMKAVQKHPKSNYSFWASNKTKEQKNQTQMDIIDVDEQL